MKKDEAPKSSAPKKSEIIAVIRRPDGRKVLMFSKRKNRRQITETWTIPELIELARNA